MTGRAFGRVLKMLHIISFMTCRAFGRVLKMLHIISFMTCRAFDRNCFPSKFIPGSCCSIVTFPCSNLQCIICLIVLFPLVRVLPLLDIRFLISPMVSSHIYWYSLVWTDQRSNTWSTAVMLSKLTITRQMRLLDEIGEHYAFMTLVVGRYEGLFTRGRSREKYDFFG